MLCGSYLRIQGIFYLLYINWETLMSLNFGKSFLSTVWWNDQEALILQTYSLYGWIVSLIEMLILGNFNIEWILVWQFGQDSSNSSNFPNIQYTQSYISTMHAYWCQLTHWLLYIDHNYVQGVVNRSVKKLNVLLHRLLLALFIAFKNSNFLLHVLKLWSNHLAKIFEYNFLRLSQW